MDGDFGVDLDGRPIGRCDAGVRGWGNESMAGLPCFDLPADPDPAAPVSYGVGVPSTHEVSGCPAVNSPA